MPSYTTPHQAIVGVLREAGISALNAENPPPDNRDFNWLNPDGSAGSPYYKDAKEPQPGFPYVVYDISAGTPEHTMGDGYPEAFEVTVDVVGANPYIHEIGSPYANPKTSPIAYLDAMGAQPFVFNGTRYNCFKFIRKSWELIEDPTRAPQDDSNGGGVYGNVYVARAVYDMEIGAAYPTLTSGVSAP